MKITSQLTKPDLREPLEDAIAYADIIICDILGCDPEDVDRTTMEETVEECTITMGFLADFAMELTVENVEHKDYAEYLEFTIAEQAEKQEALLKCEYDEDLDEAVNILVESLCGADLFEPTADGKICSRKANIGPEDLKSCIRRTIVEWNTRKLCKVH